MAGTVALTGATGFIGTTLRHALVRAGYTVRAFTRRPMAQEPGVEWVQGALSDPQALIHLVNGATHIIHCAGAVRGATRRDFQHANEDGTAALIAAAREHAQDARLLLVSSLAARHPELSWYAASKAGAERFVQAMPASMRWAIFRPTAVYGPGDREMRPLFQWLLRGVLPTPQPPGARLSLLHVDDLASAVLAWIGAPACDGAVYELCDNFPGGYDANSLARLAEAGGAPRVHIVRLPCALLSLLARANLALARALGRAPMLTPGKVREITHADWSAEPGPFMQASGWSPRIRFQDALAARRLFFT